MPNKVTFEELGGTNNPDTLIDWLKNREWDDEALEQMRREADNYDWSGHEQELAHAVWSKAKNDHPEMYDDWLETVKRNQFLPIGKTFWKSGIGVPDELVEEITLSQVAPNRAIRQAIIERRGITEQQRRRLIDSKRWTNILSAADPYDPPLSHDDAQEAFEQVRHDFIDSYHPDTLEYLLQKHPSLATKENMDALLQTPGLSPSWVARYSPFEEHHRLFLEDEHRLAFLLRSNSHVSDNFLVDALDKHGQNIVGNVIDSGYADEPGVVRSKLISMATTPKVNESDWDPEFPAGELLRQSGRVHSEFFLEPEEIEAILRVNPHLKHQLGEHNYWSHPDLAAQGKVHVAFGTNKMRQLRDLIRSKGKDSLHPKEAPAGDWRAGRDQAGNISADKLQRVIDAAPKLSYNWSEDEWTGVQRHSSDYSKVFQLNATTDQVRQMRQAGVYDTFRKMYKESELSGHPVGHAGLGWVRWTGDKRGIFVDEIQSDFGQSFIKQAANQAKQAVAEGRLTPEEGENVVNRANSEFPEDHYKKISDILFGGRHPSEVLMEAFHEWARSPRTEQRCSACQSPNVDKRHPDHVRDDQIRTGSDEKWTHRCNECGLRGPESKFPQVTEDFVGTPIHVWTPKSKAPLSQLDEYKPLPGHFHVSYEKVPDKMGFGQGTYGELPTQSNEDLQGVMTRKDTIRKSEQGDPLSKSLRGSRHKCFYCKKQATRAFRWAEGMAFIPFCDDHEESARHQIEIENKDEICGREVPLGKAALLVKDAISELRVGRSLKSPDPISGAKRYNYSHLLPPLLRSIGYRLEIHEKSHSSGGDTWHGLMANVTYKGSPDKVGFTSGHVGVHHDYGNKYLHIGNTRIEKKEHRGMKLGQAMYEALMTHAMHRHGADMVASLDEPHSTSASHVHQALARKHGMSYVAELDEPEDATREMADYDGRFGPYEYALKSEIDLNPQRACCVWVENWKGETLWGIRRKDGRYCLPGGHLESGEEPHHGAIRELFEESGVTPSFVQEIGIANGGERSDVPVYLFRAISKDEPTTEHDPDREFQRLIWVDCRQGVPAAILANLAHNPDAMLRFLGFDSN